MVKPRFGSIDRHGVWSDDNHNNTPDSGPHPTHNFNQNMNTLNTGGGTAVSLPFDDVIQFIIIRNTFVNIILRLMRKSMK